MRAFENRNVDSVLQAVAAASVAIANGRTVAFAAGGTDVLQLLKDRIPTRPDGGEPDVIVSLQRIRRREPFTAIGVVDGGFLRLGALATLTELGAASVVREQYAVLAEAADSVATPQIRNVGTIGGNLAQRPWCWYFRNGFPCF
jgi:xanthine dehydrogenase YagS FAD-binding subunit